MMSNARILRIDRRTGSAADGTAVMTPGDDIPSGIECQAETTIKQKWELAALIKDANMVCYVPEDGLQEAGEKPPATGDQVSLVMDTPDGEPGDPADAVMGEVVLSKTERLDTLSHVETYLKVV